MTRLLKTLLLSAAIATTAVHAGTGGSFNPPSSGGINAITTLQPTPTATGNTANLNTTFKDVNGDTWIVDANGDAVLASSIVPPSTVVLNNAITDPATITDAGRYVVPAAGGAGIFVGHANQYADFDGTNWTFTTPATNDRVSITTGVNAGNIYNYVGGVWTLATSSASVLDVVKLNRTTNQLTVANETVKFNQIEAGSNMTYSQTTGYITLKQGKLYELESELGLVGTAATTWHQYSWWNYSTNQPLGNPAFSETGNSVALTGQNTIAKALIQPTSDILVGVKLLGKSAGGAPNVRGGYAYAMVKQLATTATSPAPISRNSFGYVPRGTAVTLGNISARVPTTGYTSTQISTATTTASLRGSGSGLYANGFYATPVNFSLVNSAVGAWVTVQLSNYANYANSTEFLNVTDTTNGSMYRVTTQYGDVNSTTNWITIEKLN